MHVFPCETSHSVQALADTLLSQPELLGGKSKVDSAWLLLSEGKQLLNKSELCQLTSI